MGMNTHPGEASTEDTGSEFSGVYVLLDQGRQNIGSALCSTQPALYKQSADSPPTLVPWRKRQRYPIRLINKYRIRK